jgi:predicted phage terminase large subunit-like protein
MIADRQKKADALVRSDFRHFLRKSFETVSGGDIYAPNWHLDAIAWQLQKIRAGDITRLIVTMPPRYLKSITISVAWVAWMLGRDPDKRFICVSYSQDLSQKHALDCRAIMESDWYKRIFPATVIGRNGGGVADFRTTKGGGRLSTSIGGTLTGRGGDIIIIDDPLKPDDAMTITQRENVKTWFSNTLSSRLNDKKHGSIVLVMQRLHQDDLAGHLLEAGGWQHLSLPAIAENAETIELGYGRTRCREPGEALHPERESPAQLEQLKVLMGSSVFSAQYQQAPVPAKGNIIKRKWLKKYKQYPEKMPGDQIVQSWDTASKDGVHNDWSVCVTALIRKRTIYVRDVYRAQLNFPDLRRMAEKLAVKFQTKALLIEDAASGQQLIQQLRRDQPNGVPRPIARKPEGDKATRLVAASVRIENGDLLLPEDAPWLDLLERELLGFPNARHDDQVDALAQLLNWANTRAVPDALIPGCGGAIINMVPYSSNEDFGLR